MKRLLLFLLILALFPVQAGATSLEEEVNACLDSLIRLNPKKAGSNLRSGPGTNFEATSQVYDGLSFLAFANPEKDAEGKDWYKIAFTVEQQEETAYSEETHRLNIQKENVSGLKRKPHNHKNSNGKIPCFLDKPFVKRGKNIKNKQVTHKPKRIKKGRVIGT